MIKANPVPTVAKTYKIINKPMRKSLKYRGRAQLEYIKSILEEADAKRLPTLR